MRLCADPTHSKINNVIKEWFRYACDREWGKKEREERKNLASQNTTEDSD